MGSYEAAFVDWCRKHRVDFEWQIMHPMPDGRAYYVDARILSGKFAGTWVEIKGFFRPQSREKWEWFHQQFPNSELWNKPTLKALGVLT